MDPEIIEMILTGLDALLEGKEIIQGNLEGLIDMSSEMKEELTQAPRPFLTTPFEEYTVTEGLLLCVLLCMLAKSFVKIVKEGFYWLL